MAEAGLDASEVDRHRSRGAPAQGRRHSATWRRKAAPRPADQTSRRRPRQASAPPSSGASGGRARVTKRVGEDDAVCAAGWPSVWSQSQQHGGLADHLQRDRHVGGDRAAQAVREEPSSRSTTSSSASCRSSSRRPSRPSRTCPRSTPRSRDNEHRSTATIRTSASPSAAARAWWSPSIRNAERLSFAGVEQTIAELRSPGRVNNKLKLEELQGGTFTISNGGIYGSLLSTPIVNPPQSGILGLHKIEERPVAVERRGRHPADDVRRSDLRSPARRRPGSRHFPGAKSRNESRIRPGSCWKSESWKSTFKHDLVVIGGPVPAAMWPRFAPRSSASNTACIEKGPGAGRHLSSASGCIPSKALLEVSERYHDAKQELQTPRHQSAKASRST